MPGLLDYTGGINIKFQGADLNIKGITQNHQGKYCLPLFRFLSVPHINTN